MHYVLSVDIYWQQYYVVYFTPQLLVTKTVHTSKQEQKVYKFHYLTHTGNGLCITTGPNFPDQRGCLVQWHYITDSFLRLVAC